MSILNNSIHIAPLMGLLVLHFVADFVLQNSWMARKKKRGGSALWGHAALYALVVSLGTAIMTAWMSCYGYTLPLWRNPGQCLIMFSLIMGLHAATDWASSRVTGGLFAWSQHQRKDSNIDADETMHDAFVVIGLDQLIHYIQLVLVFQILYNTTNG